MNVKIGAAIAVIVLVAAGATAVYLLTDRDSDNPIDVELEIFGNADKDGRVDNKDADLVEEYIAAVAADDTAKIEDLKSRMSLRFADANNDGVIDDRDVEQIRAIADGTATHLWFLDGVQNERDIDLNIERIGAEYFTNVEMMLILGQGEDRKSVV